MRPGIRSEVLFLKDYASLIKIGNIIHCSAWLEGAKLLRYINIARVPFNLTWLLWRARILQTVVKFSLTRAGKFFCFKALFVTLLSDGLHTI